MSNILVIKHGALGDIVLATAPFQAIRQRHKNDRITLLTTKPYADMLARSPYFDDVWIDDRPKIYNPFTFFQLIKKIRSGDFIRIYDLQTSERTGWYFQFLRNPRPEWVGTVEGASHRHDAQERTSLHTIERHKQQLKVAGIAPLPAPDVSWLTADISRFSLPQRYVLLVPGGSSHRPGKRWPANHYAVLCAWTVQQGIVPVLVGTHAEGTVISTIESLCREAINLQGKTDFAEVAEIARGAVCAIGNDTGPMHLIAVTGVPSLVLFSQSSNPALCAPRGDKISVIRKEPLANLSSQEVSAWVKRLL